MTTRNATRNAAHNDGEGVHRDHSRSAPGRVRACQRKRQDRKQCPAPEQPALVGHGEARADPTSHGMKDDSSPDPEPETAPARAAVCRPMAMPQVRNARGHRGPPASSAPSTCGRAGLRASPHRRSEPPRNRRNRCRGPADEWPARILQRTCRPWIKAHERVRRGQREQQEAAHDAEHPVRAPRSVPVGGRADRHGEAPQRQQDRARAVDPHSAVTR